MLYEIIIYYNDRTFSAGPKEFFRQEIDDFAKAVANAPIGIQLPIGETSILVIPPEVAKKSLFFFKEVKQENE